MVRDGKIVEIALGECGMCSEMGGWFGCWKKSQEGKERCVYNVVIHTVAPTLFGVVLCVQRIPFPHNISFTHP